MWSPGVLRGAASFAYASSLPMQVVLHQRASPASDLYSLGVIMWCVLLPSTRFLALAVFGAAYACRARRVVLLHVCAAYACRARSQRHTRHPDVVCMHVCLSLTGSCTLARRPTRSTKHVSMCGTPSSHILIAMGLHTLSCISTCTG